MDKICLYVIYDILNEEPTIPSQFSLAVVDKRFRFPMVTGCVNTKVTEDFYLPGYNAVFYVESQPRFQRNKLPTSS
jgi:hypothetical protein